MKHRRIIIVCFGIVLCLGVFAFLTRDFWRDQFRAYFFGCVEVAARKYQRLPEDVDTVEVFTFGDGPNAFDTQGFLGDTPLTTLAHKTLTGKDAKEVVDLWGSFVIGPEFQAMCFDPAYGLQFKRHGRILFQTAVCWECSGFTVPVPLFGTVQYGFDAKSKKAVELLQTLERHLPLKANPQAKGSPH
ncbi:MAG TPA: hypothetical protein VGN61_10865 [Verrucomicrobiae bacterium]